MNVTEINKMSTKEKLQTMEALWVSLLEEDAGLYSPSWHEDILEGRKRSIENGDAKFLTLEELKASRRS